MKITVTTPGGFLHGHIKFKEKHTYDVPDSFAGYFIGVGWAEAGGDGKAEKVELQKLSSAAVVKGRVRKSKTLEIQDTQLTTGSPKVGKEDNHG